jgi:hypothetical protein
MFKYRFDWTEEKISKFLKAGRGSGSGADYLPWLTIHDLSSRGLSVRIKGRKTGRTHHLLSAIERDVFVECDWSELVIDIREQFPIDRDQTRAIAAAMRVRHPSVRGVDIVITTDFLLNVQRGARTELVALSVKPSTELGNRRTLEKLELERRYWWTQGVPWRLVTERQVSRIRSRTLLWLHEWYWTDNLAFPYRGYWEDRCSCLLAALTAIDPALPVRSLIRHLEETSAFGDGEAISAIRHLAAHRRLLLDVDVEFDVGGPLSQIQVPARAKTTPNATGTCC